MILSINDKPQVKAYSHHAYVNSIIDFPILFSFYLSDYSKEQWSISARNLNAFSHQDSISICSGECLGSKNEYRIERNLEKKDEIQTQIYQIKNIQRNAKIIYYVSAKKHARVYQDMIYSLTIHRYGYTTDEVGVNRYNYEYCIEEYPYIKMVRLNKKIFFLCSNDTNEWIVLDECLINDEIQDYNWGIVAINLDNDEYTEWLMSNYIHLSFDPSADITQVFLDYALSPCKNMRYENIYPSQFLDITYLPAGLIKWQSMIDFIKNCIDTGYYVALSQDEYFIPQRKRYLKQHMFHHNLFWGYDEKGKFFHILGYGNTFCASILSEEDFIKAGVSKEANVILYRKDYSDTLFTFDKAAFMNSLQDFLHSNVPYSSMRSIVGIKNLSYGISVFDALGKSKKGLWVASFDNRAAYLLYEHSVLWNKRIAFLQCKGYLHENSVTKRLAEHLLEVSKKIL